jgi:arginine:agmatine antiporter
VVEVVPSSAKKMGLVGASSLVVANMVGTGLFLLPSNLATIGSISTYGWIVSLIGATALGLVFAHLGMIKPEAGGPYAYARDHMGPFAAFQTNVIYWGANVIGNVAIAVSVTGYLEVFFPTLKNPWFANACTAGVIWLFIWLNTRGAKTVGGFTTLSTIAGILPAAFVGLIGWWWFDPGIFKASWNPGGLAMSSAITTSASITLWAFLGLESAAVSAGVIENPKRNVPLATVIGLVVSAAIYVSCCTVIMGILPNDELRKSGAPFADVARLMLGPSAAIIISLAAILKAAGSLVGWILIVAQSAEAAARDGMFAPSFSATNRYGAPARNLIATGLLMTALVIATSSPDVATQFSTITNATVVLMAIPYIYSVIAMWRLNRVSPEVTMPRRYLFRVLGVLACLYCIGVVLGQSAELVRKALVALLLTVPFYALVRLPGQKTADRLA